MSFAEWPPSNYCYFDVNNTLDKPLRIYWGGDIWGGFQIQDIAPNSTSQVRSRNAKRQGADVVFRLSIKRIRADSTEQDIGVASLGFSVTPVWDCPETTINFSGEAESFDFFSFNITYFYGIPTKSFSHKLTSVYLPAWRCDRIEDCPS